MAASFPPLSFFRFLFLLVTDFPPPRARFPNVVCSPRRTGKFILLTTTAAAPAGAHDLPGQPPVGIGILVEHRAVGEVQQQAFNRRAERHNQQPAAG